MNYNVIFDDGVSRADVPHELPDRLPQAGDRYKWMQPGRTLGGFTYHLGDVMTVLGRTDRVPHYRSSELGNLLVQGPHGESVWTSFEHCIAVGALRLVEE